jgi:hypothetical protein
MTTESSDIATVSAEPGEFTMSSGMPVLVERLKTRQLMRLMKILTRGLGAGIANINLADGDVTSYTTQLVSAVLFAIPEAEDETIDFVRSMVTPVGIVTNPRTKKDQEANEALYVELDSQLDNPEIEDLFSIVEQIVRVEAPHLAALGKRVAILLKLEQQTQVAKKHSND